MMELLRLYGQIALLRRGPQDVPTSPALLVATVLAFFAINCAVSFIMPPVPGPWVMHLVVEVVCLLAWYAVLLRAVKKPERFLQTATALFGYQLVLSPLLIASSWLVQRMQQQPDSPLLLPVVVLALGLAIWLLAAGGHIVKSALEWTTPASIAMVILQILATQVLLFALFPTPTP